MLRATLLGASIALLSHAVVAQDSLLDLLPPDQDPRAELQAAGITGYLRFVEFAGALMDFDSIGDQDPKLGGRVDLHLRLDGAKAGLWQGFFVSAIGEIDYGQTVDGATPFVLLPVNTAMYYPGPGNADLSVNVTQFFSKDFSVSLGKFNVIDLAAATPIVGGGGVNTFQNLNFAAPPTGLLPPYIFGGLATLNTEPARLTLAIYDPRDMQGVSGLEDPFAEGVAAMLNTTVPVKIGGLPGWQNLSIRANNMVGPDLDTLPPLLVGRTRALDQSEGAWYVGYSFQQYLHMTDETHGWGIFGLIGVSDSNPTPIAGTTTFGVAGNSPIPGREEDRFGVGFYQARPSDVLVDSLSRFIDLQPEQGIEAFYDFHLAPGVRLAADLQIIDPGLGDDIATYGGLRLVARF